MKALRSGKWSRSYTVPECREAPITRTRAATTQLDPESIREASDASAASGIAPLSLFDPRTVAAPSCSDVPLKPRRDESVRLDPGIEFTIEGITVRDFKKIFCDDDCHGFFRQHDVEITKITAWQRGREDEDSLPRRRVRFHIMQT